MLFNLAGLDLRWDFRHHSLKALIQLKLTVSLSSSRILPRNSITWTKQRGWKENRSSKVTSDRRHHHIWEEKLRIEQSWKMKKLSPLLTNISYRMKNKQISPKSSESAHNECHQLFKGCWRTRMHSPRLRATRIGKKSKDKRSLE